MVWEKSQNIKELPKILQIPSPQFKRNEVEKERKNYSSQMEEDLLH